LVVVHDKIEIFVDLLNEQNVVEYTGVIDFDIR
jgi:hypothetical protein